MEHTRASSGGITVQLNEHDVGGDEGADVTRVPEHLPLLRYKHVHWRA